ncbi:Protein of unknown function [Gryllus bimaculatus]|nr:Protein of unknown function [Gryllus bimaculatus]
MRAGGGAQRMGAGRAARCGASAAHGRLRASTRRIRSSGAGTGSLGGRRRHRLRHDPVAVPRCAVAMKEILSFRLLSLTFVRCCVDRCFSERHVK